MLGVLFIERDLLQVGDIPAMILNGIMGSAPFALFGMLLLLVASRGSATAQRLLLPRPWMRYLVGWCLAICFTALVAHALLSWRAGVSVTLAGMSGSGIIHFYLVAALIADAIAGLAGLIGIGVPFVAGNLNLSLRRIWALTRLSFKEGVRRRVLYVFSFLLVVLMFASWFVATKPEYQLKTYVAVVDLAMTPLLLFAGVLVAAFSIPSDIRQQTIHTILTKPVERFEVVLGRFFGYVGLMTVVLFVLTLVGILYVMRGIDPEAAAESLKARDPWYGTLSFENTKDTNKGENVGREWDYRSYISGPSAGVAVPAIALWTFPEPAAALGQRDKVRCEFGFDIYRTTKGYENRGVNCSFDFFTWRYRKDQDADILKRRTDLKEPRAVQIDGVPSMAVRTEEEIDAIIAEEFGLFTVHSKQITDYHTLFIDLPGGLFKNAIPRDAADRTKLREAGQEGKAALTVRVRCLSPTQYVGMARYDLYLRQDAVDGSADRMWFAVNFFKGAFGLWLRLCLVIGLAVCLSTYLSGVVSLLLALLLYVGGFFREFIEQVALNLNPGGGPAVSFYKLFTRSTLMAPLDDSVTTNIAQVADTIFRFTIRFVLNMIPDINRFDLKNFVAEGFNIPLGQLLVNFVLLVLYLLPWFIVAYFTMKSREVASAS